MDVYEVVKKLVGPIDPVGETNADNRSFENLKSMAAIVERLIGDIAYVAEKENSHMASVARSGAFAEGFLREQEADLHAES